MMDQTEIGMSLDAFLATHAPGSPGPLIAAVAKAAETIAGRVRQGPFGQDLAGQDLAEEVGAAARGETRKALDAYAEQALAAALRGAGVRAALSGEREEPVLLDDAGSLLVAFDPLDGSSDIEANSAIGTFFSAIEAPAGPFSPSHFLQAGSAQRAAGLALYGPLTILVFTAGAGVHAATLDPDRNAFRMTRVGMRVPLGYREFAIDASNSRHWPQPVRAYVEDLVEGESGPRGQDFNMRWVGAVAADVYRILVRGGVYLYPQDAREGCEHGRLRLICEANPIAFLFEQAGGAAIDGFERILDVVPRSLHARSPLIFGSRDKVERVARYFNDGGGTIPAPLFARRTLLRQ